jgi:hypothetical protein
MEFPWVGAEPGRLRVSECAALYRPIPGYHRYLSILCTSCDYTCTSLVCSLEQAKGEKYVPLLALAPQDRDAEARLGTS